MTTTTTKRHTEPAGLQVVFPADDYPQVLVAATAWEDMRYITDKTDTEVGWMMTVEELSSFQFRILEVFLLEQEAHATTTELLAEAVDQLISELLDEGRLEDVQRLNGWGHSHVNMGLFASADDNNTLAWFGSKVEGRSFVAVRTNKHGEMTADISHPSGVTLTGVTVTREAPHAQLASKWDQLLTERVKPFQRPAVTLPRATGYQQWERDNPHLQRYNDWPLDASYQPYGGGGGKDVGAGDSGRAESSRFAPQPRHHLIARRLGLVPYHEVHDHLGRTRWCDMAYELEAAEDAYLTAVKLDKALGKGSEDEDVHLDHYVTALQDIQGDYEEFWPEQYDEDALLDVMEATA